MPARLPMTNPIVRTPAAVAVITNRGPFAFILWLRPTVILVAIVATGVLVVIPQALLPTDPFHNST
jgi:hypothetical protein